MTISTIGWIVIGVAAWLVVAVVVGVLIGRMIRRRDRQVPQEPAAGPFGGRSAQITDTADVPPSRVTGRGRPRRR